MAAIVAMVATYCISARHSCIGGGATEDGATRSTAGLDAQTRLSCHLPSSFCCFSWRFFEATPAVTPFAVPPTTSWAWCECEPEIDTKLWNPFDLWRFYVRSVKTILRMPQDAHLLLFSCFALASFLATCRSSHVALQMVNSWDCQFCKQSELFHGLFRNRERLGLCFFGGISSSRTSKLTFLACSCDIQGKIIPWYPVILSYCHTVILVLYADLCRSLGPGDDRNGTTTEGGNEFEDQPGGSGTCQVPLVWFCGNVSARYHPRSTSASSLPAGVTWQFLCKSSADSEDCKDSANTCMLSLMPYDRFPKIWDLPFASLGILLSVTASSIHLFAPSAPSANDASVQT